MIKSIKVSEKGQIAIPQSVRESLGINQGDELILVQSGAKILLQKVEGIHKIVEDSFEDIVKLSENSLREIWDNKEDEIWNSYLK